SWPRDWSSDVCSSDLRSRPVGRRPARRSRLWQTEIARPDADRLAGFDHPLWVRFRKVAGDDVSSRKLFAELATDLRRFEQLEAKIGRASCRERVTSAA